MYVGDFDKIEPVPSIKGIQRALECPYWYTVRLVNFEGVIFSRILWVIEQHENWNPRIYSSARAASACLRSPRN